MHVREELEAAVCRRRPAWLWREWPAGDATALASQLSGGQPLELLFELWQERYAASGSVLATASPPWWN